MMDRCGMRCLMTDFWSEMAWLKVKRRVKPPRGWGRRWRWRKERVGEWPITGLRWRPSSR